MEKRLYQHLSDADLAQLRGCTNALVAQAEPLLNTGQLRADDWQAPTDTLSWLGWQLDVEAEARGIENGDRLYGKYQVANGQVVGKTDGTPLDAGADYFVLRLDSDDDARTAVLAYADARADDSPVLAQALREKVAAYRVAAK